MIEMIIRQWRVSRAEPSGQMLWFDPSCEAVKLYRIPHRDGDVVAPGPTEIDDREGSGYLDKVGSVSAYGPGLAEHGSDRYEQLDFLEEEDELPF